MEPTGKGNKNILVVAEAPGREEDREGIQLVGDSGKELQKHFRKAGVELREDCFLTNSIICHPANNRTPTNNELEYCRPNLKNTIEELSPDVIIPLGSSATEQVLSLCYPSDIGGISRWAGMQIPSQDLNCWICPTWHPAALLYAMRGEFSKHGNPVLNKAFSDHLAAASKLEGKPWKKVPDYKSKVEVVMQPGKAASIIRKMIKKGGIVAFDYETTSLKPEWEGSEIVSCSVAWGRDSVQKCIAYPWHGEAIEATQELIRSPLPKIASNMKFEDRWTRAEFGHRVRNWLWDTMLASHVIDFRPYITSIKFQAFALLGFAPYDEHIKPLLKSEKGKKINRIREIALPDLLLYNGLDSLLEFEVAMLQMAHLGIPLP